MIYKSIYKSEFPLVLYSEHTVLQWLQISMLQSSEKFFKVSGIMQCNFQLESFMKQFKKGNVQRKNAWYMIYRNYSIPTVYILDNHNTQTCSGTPGTPYLQWIRKQRKQCSTAYFNKEITPWSQLLVPVYMFVFGGRSYKEVVKAGYSYCES